MKCHSEEIGMTEFSGKKRVLLMGNPNVGKSVIFSALTNKAVMTANYAGTTVSAYKGNLIGVDDIEVIDVPGIYSLDATSEAEMAAVKMYEEKTDLVVCVLDATNLERNLKLGLELRKKQCPVIYLLNMCDIAERKGIRIDKKKLEERLQAPVIPTVAVRRAGFQRLFLLIKKYLKDPGSYPYSINASFTTSIEEISYIAESVQERIEPQPSKIDRWEKWTLQPLTGVPIALIVVILSLGFVVGVGKAIRAVLLLPLLNNYYVPFVESLAGLLVSDESMIYQILVGEFGVLIKGIEWPFALILPYVILFYIVLSILEDSGYLPRLGVLIDGVFKKIGLHGGSVIPVTMGYGCAVPAIIGTRASSSRKERIIIASLVTLAVPCIAQTGAFIALLGDHSILLLFAIFLVSFFIMFISGTILNRKISGVLEPTLIEVPNLLMPSKQALWRKVWMRTKHFMIEAEIPMIIGILVAALTIETGVLNYFSVILEPVVVSWLGLPPEASVALVLGVIRRELAVLPLLGMDLTVNQMFVGALIALLYLPCMSVFFVLIKEFRIRIAATITAATIILAFLVGGLVNQLLRLFGGLL
ncbi:MULTISPECIES: ferrous iron transporter B [Bacillaceae]|uniref:Ferrous iron transporter B n=1 Tax=Evansella alkalicola TaxID=745819 RepID=A0ABS6JRQ1_9BACI|nr:MULTISPECIES: ferrous iron transporter B [Bacillaceae]MBU9721232.1 ferrous iron transporter B [Bacillus alkalicola]